jgi:GNAT superfamily N-acetyltransferase
MTVALRQPPAAALDQKRRLDRLAITSAIIGYLRCRQACIYSPRSWRSSLPLLPPMPLEIRAAIPEDAPAACQVMRRSIAELCVADHRNDEAILKRWLSNKTPEVFASWIRQRDNSLLVAVEGDNIVAVGSVTNAGQITLNYVSPDARFRGVSRALLGALEARAIERGNARCTLTSTETARRFYRANGYVEDGPPVGHFGMSSGYPMAKPLASHNP